jgi:hypothetical protein
MNRVNGWCFIGVFILAISFTTIPVVHADASQREDTMAGPMSNEEHIYDWYKTHPESLLYSTDMACPPFKIMAFPEDYNTLKDDNAQPGSGNASISAWRPVLPSYPFQGTGSPVIAPTADPFQQPAFVEHLPETTYPVNADPTIFAFQQQSPCPIDIPNGIYSYENFAYRDDARAM